MPSGISGGVFDRGARIKAGPTGKISGGILDRGIGARAPVPKTATGPRITGGATPRIRGTIAAAAGLHRGEAATVGKPYFYHAPKPPTGGGGVLGSIGGFFDTAAHSAANIATGVAKMANQAVNPHHAGVDLLHGLADLAAGHPKRIINWVHEGQGSAGAQWHDILRHPVYSFQKAQRGGYGPSAAADVGGIKGLTVGQYQFVKEHGAHPLRDPLGDFLIAMPAIGAGGRLADLGFGGKLSAAERSLVRPGGGEPVFLRSSHNLGIKAIQIAHDRLVQRLMNERPGGVGAGYGALRMRGAATRVRYAARIRTAIAQDLRQSTHEINKEMRKAGVREAVGSRKIAGQVAGAALRAVSENGLPLGRAIVHEYLAARDLQRGLDPIRNQQWAQLYRYVHDLGLTKLDQQGRLVVNEAKFPALAQVDRKILAGQTTVDELLRRYGFMTAEGQRVRAGAPNVVYGTLRPIPEAFKKSPGWRTAEDQLATANRQLELSLRREERWRAKQNELNRTKFRGVPEQSNPYADIVRIRRENRDALAAKVRAYEVRAGLHPDVAAGRQDLYTAMQEHPNVGEATASRIIDFLDQRARQYAAETGGTAEDFYNQYIKDIANGVDVIPADALHEAMLDQHPFDEAAATARARELLRTTGKDKAGTEAWNRTVPPGARTVKGLVNLMRELHGRAVAAEAARTWYALRGQGFMDVSPSVEAADRLMQLEAIYSPRKLVAESTASAIRAAHEHAATGEVTYGMPRIRQPQKATALLSEGIPFTSSGLKTPMYRGGSLATMDPVAYRALMDELGIPHGRDVVIDTWMRRAFKYDKKPPTEPGGKPGEPISNKQYAFASEVTRHIADQLGWLPREAQASIWTHIKAEIESGRQPTAEDLAKAGMTPADFFAQQSAQIYFEGEHPMLPPEAQSWSAEKRVQYLHAKLGVIYDEQGRNMILQAMDVYGRRGSIGYGEWEGTLTPSAATQVLSGRLSTEEAGVGAPHERPYQIAPYSRQVIEEVAAAHGFVFNQDAVGYGQLFSDTALSHEESNAVVIGRILSPEEIQALRANGLTGDALFHHAPGDQTIIANLGDTPHPEFRQHVNDVLDATLGRTETYRAAYDSGLVNREDYGGRIRTAAGRQPGLEQFLADLRERSAAVDRQFLAQEEAPAPERLGGAGGGGTAAGLAEPGGLGPRGDFTPPNILYHEAEYRGIHQAPGVADNAPMHAVDRVYPNDVYDRATQVRYYGQGGGGIHSAQDREVFNLINRLRGKPDEMVTVYRAVPEGVDTIHPGDWVTPVRSYAEMHAEGNLPRGVVGHVISERVPARELYTNGDSMLEWGWNPRLAQMEQGRVLGGYEPATGTMYFTPESTAATFLHEPFHAIRQSLSAETQRVLLDHYGVTDWTRGVEEAFVRDMMAAHAGEPVAPILQRAYRELSAFEPGRNYAPYRVAEDIPQPSPIPQSRISKVIRGQKSPISPKKFTGTGILHGDIPDNLIKELAVSWDRALRGIHIAEQRNAWARSGSKEWRSKYDVLVREEGATPGPVGLGTEQLLGLKRSTLDPLPGNVLDHEVGFIAGVKALLEDKIPGWNNPDWQRYEEGLASQKADAPNGYVWVDRRVMGNLNRFVRPEFGGLAGFLLRRVDDLNSAVTAATVYLKIGHTGTRVGTNAFTNLVQGSLNPLHIRDAIKLWRGLSREDKLRAIKAAGVHYWEALPQRSQDIVGDVARGGANFWARTDQIFRFNSLAYEAFRVGIKTPEEFHRFLNILEDPQKAGVSRAAAAQAIAVAESADRAAIMYGQLNDFERNALARAIWFYPWLKGSAVFAKDTMLEHPFKALGLYTLGSHQAALNQQQLGSLPSYEKALTQVGGPNAAGQPLVSDFSTFSPFSTAADVLEMGTGLTPIASYFNPTVSAGLAAVLGQDQYGRPIKNPSIPNELKNFFQQIVAVTPEAQILSAFQAPANQSNRMFPASPEAAFLRYLFGPAFPRRVNLPKAHADYLREIKGG